MKRMVLKAAMILMLVGIGIGSFSACEEELTSPKDETSEHEHVWSDWTTTEDATCEDIGIKERTCACGEKETQRIPDLGGHQYDLQDICTICGAENPDANSIPPLDYNLVFTLNADQASYTVRYTGAAEHVTIPETYNGLPVTAIGDHGFYNCSSLVSVSIPNSVTEIGYAAFCNCTSLTELTIPRGVVKIGNTAFGNCFSLTSVSISNTVELIEEYAFYMCTELQTVTFEGDSSLKDIASMTFYGCTQLHNVTIPDGVESIGIGAFGECTGLEHIILPSGLTKIDESAFYNCSALNDVYVYGTERDWGEVEIGEDNSCFINATRYYYTETQPAVAGNYWHDVDGVPTKW